MIKLIINADDFGYRKLYNKMILELIEENAVTSTSVMVDEIDSSQSDQVEKLIDIAQRHKASVGLHIYFKNTNFTSEIERQFDKFKKIFGFDPNYLDIHKDDYLEDGYPVIKKFCEDKKIPCKEVKKPEIFANATFFSGTKKSFDRIKEWLASLQEGFYVINFHPGYFDPESKSSLNKERETDAENIRKMMPILPVYNIQLANFNDLASLK